MEGNSHRIHEMECTDPWFTFLKDRIKPVEGRKGKEKNRKILPGDYIRFYNKDKSFYALVKKIDTFNSLDEYLLGVGVNNALPGIKTFEEGKKIYLQWSTLEEIEQLGFLGIWVDPCDDPEK